MGPTGPDRTLYGPKTIIDSALGRADAYRRDGFGGKITLSKVGHSFYLGYSMVGTEIMAGYWTVLPETFGRESHDRQWKSSWERPLNVCGTWAVSLYETTPDYI